MSNQKIEIPANCKASITIDNGLIVIECEEQKQVQKYVPSLGDFVTLNMGKSVAYGIASARDYVSTNEATTGTIWLITSFNYLTDFIKEPDVYAFLDIRPMTDQEKEAFIQRLNDEGYQWNAEKNAWRHLGGSLSFVKFIFIQ